MSDHLLLISLGPVQDFIAQARRSRDLWMGSQLLSEISRAAAIAIESCGGSLIFPASAGQGNVANKILARVPGDPAVAARAARSAARDKLVKIANEVRGKQEALLIDDRTVWDEQIETLIEFAAAWSPIGPGGYVAARNEVGQRLAGRKNLREFKQWKRQRGNAPKSSLDGARETVLKERPTGHGAVAALRLSRGEQLDAVGMIKRAGGDPGQFIPLSNIALAKWMQMARQECPDQWGALIAACRDAKLSRVTRKDDLIAGLFGFDAEVFLEDRWSGLFEEEDVQVDASKWGETHVRPILKRMSPPNPYVACIIADGDRMGQAISALESEEAHREFSNALASFAPAAKKVIEADHLGALIYSGGDDVLAFVTLQDAIACAEALRGAFVKQMKPNSATLSVGIGIGHILDGMAHLRELAKEAERLAKGDKLPEDQQRDAVAIVLDKRSGGKNRWRGKGDAASRMVDAIKAAGSDDLPSGKIYEVRRDASRFPAPGTASSDAEAADCAHALWRDVCRSLARAHGDSGVDPGKVGLSLESGDAKNYQYVHSVIADWVDRMLIARMIAESAPRARKEVVRT